MLRLRPKMGRPTTGVTFPELLVVVSIIGLAVAASVPLITESVRSARIRAAADQLTYSLRAARMLAVTKREVVAFTVAPHPENFYAYTDTYGDERRVDLPRGARISSSTAPTIDFRPNGSIAGAEHEVVLESGVEGRNGFEIHERWTLRTNVIGVTSVIHERLD
jgi:type II secretory pathway pseudopilin PulG